MSANLLFFSNKCEGSQVLINMMKSEGVLKYFTEICTDNNPHVPREITGTPTLFIKGISEPYVAADAFIWFSKIKQARIQNQMQTMANSQRQYMQNNLSNCLPNKDTVLLGFNKHEMEGISDSFAFVSDNATAVPHSQLSYDNIPNHRILENRYGNEEIKLSEKELIKYSGQILSDRQKQDHIFKNQIDSFMKQVNQK